MQLCLVELIKADGSFAEVCCQRNYLNQINASSTRMGLELTGELRVAAQNNITFSTLSLELTSAVAPEL